jgi:Raf kinase inhibitor-like YbhB/YbcL family protein
MKAMLVPLILAALACTTVGCGQDAKEPADENAMVPEGEQAPVAVIELTSGAFIGGDAIPSRYSCDGENVSPPLAWGTPPDGTKSFALVMDDPDAVAVAKKVWDHWILYNLPAGTMSLPEGLPTVLELGNGARQGQGSSGIGYRGPCPPRAAPHRYYFKLYALDTLLDLAPGATKDELLAAMKGHVLGEGELMGIYVR